MIFQELRNISPVTVASHPHFDQHFEHQPDICQRAKELEAEGKTIIMVQHDNEVCGLFAVADTPRPNSRPVLEKLEGEHGVRTVMLTDDSKTVAQAIGR